MSPASIFFSVPPLARVTTVAVGAVLSSVKVIAWLPLEVPAPLVALTLNEPAALVLVSV